VKYCRGEKRLKKRPLFITFEGVECSGKTTQSALLKEYFEKKGYNVLLTREPGGTLLSGNIRKILLNPEWNITPLGELFLYEAARAQHVKEVILPALEDGRVVICDRFTDSTVAYQAYGRKLGLKFVNKLNLMASFGLTPLLTIYLDIMPSKYLIRQKNLNRKYEYGSNGDRIEREPIRFHREVRKGYLAQAEKYSGRIKIIRMQKTPEKTQMLIRKIVDRVL